MKLYYALKKELTILLRNKSALLALFIMPALFILIMSLAQKDIYKEYTNAHIEYTIVNDDNGTVSAQFIQALQKFKNLTFDISTNLKEAQQTTKEGSYQFTLHIAKGFSEKFYKITSKNLIDIYLSPTTKAPTKLYFQSKILETMMTLKMTKMFNTMTMYNETVHIPKPSALVHTHYLYDEKVKNVIPTATQQNVPAWIVFSMFFVIIPIASLFIIERDDGTLMRLKAMHSPKSVFLISKILPYMLINQLQLYLMILVGVFLVPLFGGDTLDVHIDFMALCVISCSISFAAIGFALFLSTQMKTVEQASVIGALTSVIMGAVGGIMIPKLVMPPLMQDLTVLSPMSWALEGMLDVFVRHMGVSSVVFEASVLLLFGIISLILTILYYKRT